MWISRYRQLPVWVCACVCHSGICLCVHRNCMQVNRISCCYQQFNSHCSILSEIFHQRCNQEILFGSKIYIQFYQLMMFIHTSAEKRQIKKIRTIDFVCFWSEIGENSYKSESSDIFCLERDSCWGILVGVFFLIGVQFPL